MLKNATFTVKTDNSGSDDKYSMVYDNLPTILLLSIFLCMLNCFIVTFIHVRICKRRRIPHAITFSSFEIIQNAQIACDTVASENTPDVEAIEIFDACAECDDPLSPCNAVVLAVVEP